MKPLYLGLFIWIVCHQELMAQSLTAQLHTPSVPQEQFQTLELQVHFKQLPATLSLVVPVSPTLESTTKGPLFKAQAGEIIAHWTIRYLSQQTGEILLPPLVVTFQQDGTNHQIKSKALHYQVTPTANFDQPQPFTRPIPPNFDPTYLGFGLSGWLLLAVPTYFWMKKNKSAPTVAQKTPKELALERIATLKPLCQQQAHKQLHLGLSTALKEFIQTQYNIPAQGQTTEEFLTTNRHSQQLPESALVALDRYFKLSDQVKFAGYEPGVSLSEQALESITAFVEDEGDPV